MADPEPGDGDVVGDLVGGQDAEGDVLVAEPLDLAGGAHPDRVGVEEHAEQGLGVVGGVAVPVVAVLTLNASTLQVSLLKTCETAAWLLLGLGIYLFYGIRHSRLGNRRS